MDFLQLMATRGPPKSMDFTGYSPPTLTLWALWPVRAPPTFRRRAPAGKAGGRKRVRKVEPRVVRETEREQDRHYESETAISFPTIPSVHEPLHMVIRAGPNYSNIRILVRKISIRSLNQYSELRFFSFSCSWRTRAREANYKRQRHQAEKRERWRKNRYIVSLYFITQH